VTWKFSPGRLVALPAAHILYQSSLFTVRLVRHPVRLCTSSSF